MITYVYNAKIINVVDGDTVDAIVDLGFHVQATIRFRLAGVDTAEMHSKVESERVIAKSAKDFLIKQILDKDVRIA
jgi:micrococcal nuclease